MITAVAFASASAFAQITSKKGENYLPESGDWAISFDAVPFVTYAGNLLNGGTNTSPGVNYVGNYPWAITGKMFTSETTAYRAMVRIGFGSETWNNYVSDDLNTSTDPKFVSDQLKSSARNIVLGGGMEWRRGKTRLQGFYGGMLWLAMGGGKDTYTWGNAISSTNLAPTSTDWTMPLPNGGAPMAMRTLEEKMGSTMGVGVRGFIGAEYFVLPKISIGAEYGWGLGFMSTGEGEVTVEYFDTVTNGVKTQTVNSGKSSMFGIDTDITNNMMGTGSLNITFHF